MTNQQSNAESVLRRRIRFLPSTLIGVMLIIAYTFMASDFAATKNIAGVIYMAIFDAAIVAAVVYRWRLKRRLARLLSGKCIECGYDLRATPDRCPECGTRVGIGG
jgi:hypothetical protein